MAGAKAVADIQNLAADLQVGAHLTSTSSARAAAGTQTGLIIAGLDFLCILLIPVLCSFLTIKPEHPEEFLNFWFLVAGVTVALIHSHGGYRRSNQIGQRRRTSLSVCCFLATSVVMLTVAVLLGHEHALGHVWAVPELGITSAGLILVRSRPVTKILGMAHRAPTRGPIIICYDQCPAGLEDALLDHGIAETIAGVLLLSGSRGPDRNARWPIVPNVQTLLDTMHSQAIRDIVFVYQPELEGIPGEARREMLSELLTFPARIWMVFDLQPQLPAFLKNRCGYRLFEIGTQDLINSLNPTKRIFDLICALLLVIFISPLILAIGLTIRLDGQGPAIFRQIRIGAHGKEFVVYKFRTMIPSPAGEFSQATPNDPRVTQLGRLLRRTSLDEVLQLVNVIRGEMSLVGPRPHAPETHVEGIPFEHAVRYYRLRHRVKPGITGLAQIRGQRGETQHVGDLIQRIASDLEYIENWSIWLDLKIIAKTLPIVIRQTNAY